MKATAIEIAVWVAFGIAAVVYFIAFLLIGNAGYGEDVETSSGWLAFAGSIAGITLVPAILLTGIRQLLPSQR